MTERTQDEIKRISREIYETTGYSLSWDRIGNRPIEERALAKRKRRAGVRALVAKYGAASASRIVAKHSGRVIRETPKGN